MPNLIQHAKAALSPARITPLRRLIATAFLAAVVVINVRTLVAAGLNNLAARDLIVERGLVSDSLGVPTCAPVLRASPAESFLATASQVDPTNQRIWVNIGHVQWLEGRCEEAADAWEQAIALEPSDKLVYWWRFWSRDHVIPLRGDITSEVVEPYAYQRGQRAEVANDAADAVEWYQLALALLPDRKAAQSLTALYQRSNQPDRALAIWRELVDSLAPDDPDHWWALGEIRTLEQDWNGAAEAYHTGAELNKKDPSDFWLREAHFLTELQQWQGAETVYRKALALHPRSLGPYLGIGTLRSAVGDQSGAIQWFRQAMAVDPNSADPYYNTGMVYYGDRNWSEAAAFFSRALERNPQFSSSSYYLARCFYELGDQTKAVATLREAISAYQGEPWTWAKLLGEWELARGNKAQALSAFQLALQWHANDQELIQQVKSLSAG